jgi:hypothetical protein
MASNAAWLAGQTMRLEQAIASALTPPTTGG